MRKNNDEAECVAVIGSVTLAMRAQGVLAKAAIRTEVVKADSSVTGAGCAYALMFPCEMSETIKEILKKAGIRARMVRR